jgi:hypothetical protein
VKLQVGERVWVEVIDKDGKATRFMVLGLDQGRIHVSADGITLRPDGESAVIVSQI